MKTIVYRKDLMVGTYLDPFNGFKEKVTPFEIRHNEITGVTCRILPARHRAFIKPDIKSYLEKSPESTCPFCPDLIDKITPKFTPDVLVEGKFQRGSALLFPNAFPHDKFNCVAIFSDKHFLSLSELTADIMLDGFLVCRDYFKRMKEVHPSLCFCSINWNYMPPAGGGLVHPHVQTVIGQNPTSFVKTIYTKAQNYRENTGDNLWRDLIAYEKKMDERFIASTGNIAWMVSFAPHGMVGEVWFVFNEKTSIFSLGDDDFRELLTGFSRIFGYFESKNFISFNMSLFATLAEDESLWVQGRIMPRFVLLPLGASDINYFEKLHDEIICPVIPEEMCKELKSLF